MRQKWIVEEVEHNTGATVYREVFEVYELAVDAYDRRKTVAVLNTVSLSKETGRHQLLEEKTQKSFLAG